MSVYKILISTILLILFYLLSERNGDSMKFDNLTSSFSMNNGVTIPCIGLGTWKMNSEIAHKAVLEGIEVGYRHIDTAAAYFNEDGVGRAIKEAGIDRKELFITSKLANTEHGYNKTLNAFDESLNRLQLDYMDLYLIHWPVIEEHKDRYKEDIIETWQAFEKLYKEGKIRSIGVSNFMIEHLDIIINNTDLVPMVNQIQFNPRVIEEELRAYCKQHNIVVEGWSPLVQGQVFELEILNTMAEKYNRSIAQICIRFALQNHVLPLPKTTHKDRMIENASVFDFEISDEDMKEISKLKALGRLGSEPNIPRGGQQNPSK